MHRHRAATTTSGPTTAVPPSSTSTIKAKQGYATHTSALLSATLACFHASVSGVAIVAVVALVLTRPRLVWLHTAAMLNRLCSSCGGGCKSPLNEAMVTYRRQHVSAGCQCSIFCAGTVCDGVGSQAACTMGDAMNDMCCSRVVRVAGAPHACARAPNGRGAGVSVRLCARAFVCPCARARL